MKVLNTTRYSCLQASQRTRRNRCSRRPHFRNISHSCCTQAGKLHQIKCCVYRQLLEKVTLLIRHMTRESPIDLHYAPLNGELMLAAADGAFQRDIQRRHGRR